MRNTKIVFFIFLFLISIKHTLAQYEKDSVYSKFFIGSTLAMVGNLDRENSPDFFQLNTGYRITNSDALSLELKTWKYEWSLGIPWSSFEAPEEKFPGYVREYGFAIAYQRFWYKGLYTGIHVTSAWQSFVDENDNKMDNGFQFFNTYRLGYHIKLFQNRFFIEPSIAITHRPYHTPMPESFAQLDNKWPNYFIGEPGLHFGFNLNN